MRRHPCLGLLAGAVAGIAASEFAPCYLALALAAALCFAVAAVWGRRLLPFWLCVATLFLVRHELDWRRAPGRVLRAAAVVQGIGIVTGDPIPIGVRTPHSRFPLRVTSLLEDGRTLRTDFPVMIFWSGPAPAWGDEIAFTGSVEPIAPPRNPGEFDEPAYLARQGIFREIACHFPEDNRILAAGRGNRLVAWGRRSRAALERRLTLGLEDSPEISALVATLTLGLKKELPQEDRDLFQRTGTMHLFVVNGLHIALLAGVLRFLLKPLGLHRRAFALVIIPLLFAYALLTGLSPGSVRAALMAAVLFGASFADRKPFSWNTFAAAALLLLAWDTNELFQPGFQFSFGVVGAILLLAGRFQKWMLPFGLPDEFLPRALWTRWQQSRATAWPHGAGLVAVSAAACLGAMPFTAGYFHLVTPSALLANLLMVPLAAAILAESVFSLLASLASTGLALLFNNANWLLAASMLRLVHAFASLPGSYLFVPGALSQIECEITVLDLHPGQAVLVRSHGQSWLIDCGNLSAYHRFVRPPLLLHGLNGPDGLVLTHGATPAAPEVIQDFRPATLMESALPDHSHSRAALANLPKTLLKAGDRFGGIFKVLFPPPDAPARTAADRSLVLQIQACGKRILLMSDSGFATEHWLLENHIDIQSDILVEGSQPTDLSGTPEFLTAVHPKVIIQGSRSYFAPPLPKPKTNAQVFQQDQTGAITIDLQPTSMKVTPYVRSLAL